MNWRGRARPGVADAAFGIVLIMGLIGGRHGFLNDPGTFWHHRLGRDILQTGTLPWLDTLTYTQAGLPWPDMYWGFDALLAAIVARGGWAAAVAATAVALGWIYGALALNLLRRGASSAAALSAAVVAAGVGSVHFLTRPHLFTFAFVLWTLCACRRFHDRGGREIWLVPLVMVAWANVHGGFLAGPLIVATAALGHAASGPLDANRWRRIGVFLAVAALSVLAPLANPYGFGLYRHVFDLMATSGVTELIFEHQPPQFGKPLARLLEGLILALVALQAFSRTRLSRYELAHVVVWLHMALTSIRHAPLLAIAAAPTLARLIDGLLAAPASSPSPSPSPSPVPAPERVWWSPWPALATVAVLWGAAVGLPFGGHDPTYWPLSALPALDREPISARLFHEQDWGGLVEDRCQPPRLAFMDDRFELWGRKPILEYLGALNGGPDWDALRDRLDISLVWLRPDRDLARRLGADPAWEVVHRDGVSVLFKRKPNAPPTVAATAP